MEGENQNYIVMIKTFVKHHATSKIEKSKKRNVCSMKHGIWPVEVILYNDIVIQNIFQPFMKRVPRKGEKNKISVANHAAGIQSLSNPAAQGAFKADEALN